MYSSWLPCQYLRLVTRRTSPLASAFRSVILGRLRWWSDCFSGMATVDTARDRWLQILWKWRFLVFKVRKCHESPSWKLKMKANFFFLCFARNDRRYTPLCHCLQQRHRFDLSAAPPLGASNGPEMQVRWGEGDQLLPKWIMGASLQWSWATEKPGKMLGTPNSGENDRLSS